MLGVDAPNNNASRFEPGSLLTLVQPYMPFKLSMDSIFMHPILTGTCCDGDMLPGFTTTYMPHNKFEKNRSIDRFQPVRSYVPFNR